MTDQTQTENGLAAADYTGTVRRRIFAFIIDYLIVLVALLVATFVIGIVGIVTFGVGWLLFFVMAPLIIGPYVAFTLGGTEQATPGMKAMGIALKRDDGKPIDPLFALVYAILFWALVSVLTPLSLLIVFFTERKRALHDLLLGTSVVRTATKV